MKKIMLLLMLTVSGSVFAAEPQLLFENSDFEKGSLLNWQAEGAAFEVQPVKGDNIAVRGSGPSKLQGDYWIGTFEKYNGKAGKPGDAQGDGSVGKLTSTEFKIEKPYINFLIGGGDSTETAVWIKVEGKNYVLSSGKNAEAMRQVSADVREFLGQKARIVIADISCGGWGHVNADNFTSSDQPVVKAVKPKILSKDIKLKLKAADKAKTPKKSGFEHQPQYHITYSGGDVNNGISELTKVSLSSKHNNRRLNALFFRWITLVHIF